MGGGGSGGGGSTSDGSGANGTPLWSPEADCYSFGVLVYEVLSRKAPFYALTQPEKDKVRLQQLKYAAFQFDADLHEEYGVTEEQQRTLWLKKRGESLQQRRPDATSPGSIPADRPDVLFDLMERCWADAKEGRPSFAEVISSI